MKKTVLIQILLILSTMLMAQTLRRVNCLSLQKDNTRSLRRSRVAEYTSDRTYRQLVVLVTFSDCDFQADAPLDFYHQLFNEPGFNLRQGPGSVSDYFRDQSHGKLNLVFDIVGPFKVHHVAGYGNGIDVNWGRDTFTEALQQLYSAYPGINYSAYDWDGDGEIEQIVFVYAGYAGNQYGKSAHIWPSSGDMDTFTLSDGHTVSRYTASGELWSNNTSCGIGTICHEYSHCLGLPDLYPTTTLSYSCVLDEWDLMDSGTVSNYGSCPPNYSAVEKMQMGWLHPVELTRDTVITTMRPIAEGGEAYIIHHTDNEYYLLENRQQKGWDAALPGRGLLVWHVNYDSYNWRHNTVNNIEGRPDCHLMAADNLNYTDWLALYRARGGGNAYQDKANRMNKMLLSTSAYPWSTDSTSTNATLTDTSVPSSTMYNRNAVNSYLLSKPIRDICQHSDGTISFSFHASNTPSAIHTVIETSDTKSLSDAEIYDMMGRKIESQLSRMPKGIFIVNGRKFVIP